MAQTNKVNNFGVLNVTQATLLDVDSAAGSAVSLTVRNNAGFNSGDYIAVGQLGSAECEITTVSSVVTSTGITVASLAFAHSRLEPITGLFADQVKLYRAPNVNNDPPADSTFNAVGSPTAIVGSSLSTSITDATGGSDFWYKFTYYNSTTSGETAIGDSVAVRGGGYGDYATLAEIRAEAGMTNNPNISDSDIAKKRKRAQNIINGYLYEVYTTPFAVPVPPLINTSCIMLAAGYLMLEEYGQSATGMSKDGNAKIAQVIDPDGKSGKFGILDMIKMREIILTDEAGTSLLLTDLISSYPDDSTDATTTVSDPQNTNDGANRYFYIADRY